MYKKSIFGQLFSFTVLVFIVSFFVIGTLLYSFLGEYLTERNEEDLNATAEKLAELTVSMRDNDSELFRRLYQYNINSISASVGAIIFILNESGQPVATSDNVKINIGPEFYQPALDGQNVKYIGNLGGFFNTTMLTVGQPIRMEDKIIGAVFLSLPVPEIHQIRTDVIKIFLFSVCFVVVVALVFIYLMSNRLTKPLKMLNNAAKSIANGEFERRVNLNVDNEIGELGDTFNAMAESIEQLETMRRSFVANVSHELRTPMTTITGFIEGILDGTIPPERHEQYLKIVLDESKRLSRLVNDLLDISRMEQGKFKMEPREFDINEMVRLSVIKMEKRITEKQIQLTVGFKTENQSVYADKDSIQRVLTNLLDNAVKFTPEGGFIDISTGLENGKVFVSIQNSGMGIAKNELKHVFDRFYKTDKSRSLDKTGVGLGLFIVKSIMQNHGENIWAESEPGEYARFNFTLKPADDKKPSGSRKAVRDAGEA